MRVTQFTFYNNFLQRNQDTLSELNKTQTQIASGKKIKTLYDDPIIYNNFLKLDEEVNSFVQIKKSASFAINFARETDTTINDIVSTLDSFKTKLLNAANDTNNETSRRAIVSELKGELNHLKDLANTSIDGKYIFSGSAFNKKPIDDNFEYQGNDKKVKAFLGAKVEREYNIPGSEIFLGRDNDYKKVMTTNIPQYDKMKAHPEFVVRGNDGKLYIDKSNPKADSDAVAVNEPITIDSEIRRLTGVEDIDNGDGSYSDGTSYFYLKGKKSNGESIDTQFSLKNSAKVSDLLEKIGEIYGNNESSKVVDVSLNKDGEIEIKDLNSGKIMNDFFLVASNNKRDSVEDLVKNGDYIVEFQKSFYPSALDSETIKANNKNFDNRVFTFGSYFYNFKERREALVTDKVYNVLGDKGIKDNDLKKIDHIIIKGTDTNGNSVNEKLDIDSTTTLKKIVDTIKDKFGDVDVRFENGEIKVIDKTISKTQKSKLSIQLTAQDKDNNNLTYFPLKDSINFDNLWMDKKENLIKGNYSNIIKDKKIVIKNGEVIVNNNPLAQKVVNDTTTIMDSLGSDKVPQELKVQYRDKNGEFNIAKIVLDDNGSYFEVNGNKYYIYNNEGDKSLAFDHITTVTEFDKKSCKLCEKDKLTKGVTFKQLGDVISMLVTDNIPANNDFESYKTALKNAKKEAIAGVDKNGKFFVKDLSNKSSKIDLAISNKENNIYFQANNAITIDSAKTDFFDILKKAIKAVENGENYANAFSKDPRNFGIQGALKAIEHVVDRVRRVHAKIGAVSNEFNMTIERVDTLKVHVETLQSENIDTDIGEASMKLNSLQLSYQALLASISKVNKLTLLNYLR